MSFGTDRALAAAARPCATPSTTPSRTTSCWSRPPPTTPIAEQGDPANLLQPTGTGPDITPDKGLSVTAADASDARASFAGRGSADLARRLRRLRLEPGGQRAAGIFGAFTAGPNELETGVARRCRRARRARAAPPSPATRATPTCRGPRWRRRWSRPPRALIRHLNPDLTAGRRSCGCSRRPRAGPRRRVDRRPRLGDPRRRRRADAAPRASTAAPPTSRVQRLPARTASPRSRCAGRRPTRLRRACAPPASRATSSGARPTAAASGALIATTRTSRRCTLRRGAAATASTRSPIDHAGNREPAPQAGRRADPRRRR